MRLVLLAFAVALAGCQGNRNTADYIVQIPNQCRADGWKDGTPEFAQCQQSYANVVAAAAAVDQARAARLQNTFATMAVIGSMQPAPAPPPMPVQCTSVRTGYGYSTRCF